MVDRQRQISVNFEGLRDPQRFDQFALQTTFQNADITYAYLAEDRWTTDIPTQRPDGKKIIFNDDESFMRTSNAYGAWFDLREQFQRERPEFPEKTLQRITDATSENPVIFFIPWGTRYEGTFGKSEQQAMDSIDRANDVLQTREIPSRVLIMPADVYAKDINGLDPQLVDEYYAQVAENCQQRGYDFAPWSDIRTANVEQYQQLAQQLTEEKILTMLPRPVIENALKAARRRSNFTDESEIKNAAFAYLRERLAEATIVEDTLQPIKLSMVPKFKDRADLELPRLYMIPENLQFPWLIKN